MYEHLLASRFTVGDWGGDETLAAAKFNLVVQALIECATLDNSHTTDDRLYAACHTTWDRLGADETLLSLTPEQAKTLATELF